MATNGRENGLQINSWRDVSAVAALVSVAVGVIAWGLKLEARIDAVSERANRLERQVGNGILPRAEERVRAVEQRLDRHEEGAH